MTSVARVCSVEGCGRSHSCRGYCSAHYKRFVKGLEVNTPILERRLPGQKERCPVPGCEENIRLRGMCQTHAVQKTRQGFATIAMTRGPRKHSRPQCFISDCKQPIENLMGACKRHGKILASYRMSVLQLNDSYAAGCSICGRTDALVIDHDHTCCDRDRSGRHTCGKCIRGVLCDLCNRGLGFFGDNVEGLLAAVAYVSGERAKLER